MAAREFKTGCTGKKEFQTFCLASASAKRLNRRDGDTHVEAYHCRCCNRFHVGESRSYGVRHRKRDSDNQG